MDAARTQWVKATSRLLGMPEAEFRTTILPYASEALLATSPETINIHVEDGAKALEVSKPQYLKMAKKLPQLLLADSFDLRINVEKQALFLGLTMPDYSLALRRAPELIRKDFDDFKSNATGNRELLTLNKPAFAKLAMENPGLLLNRPDTLEKRFTETAALLGIPLDKYIGAVRKRPSLCGAAPSTVCNNITTLSEGLRMPVRDVIAAALLHPALFQQAPETVLRHATTLRKIADIDPERTGGFEGIVRSHPIHLSRSDEALHGRYVATQQQLFSGNAATICNQANSTITNRITAHYQQRIAETGKGTRTLQRLHALGVIPTLPEGIAPVAIPRR